ncbi:unnamed protein product [Oppiella nova]|uniref:ABC transporter domain-containing protein n=1 Tax=Oppiella nova TaxID=334625 RepID=A0A7R9Q950_9ACAR|nr:unnamed protein product [Oppiella nova]CAG2159530.1 unnamed protein product [Oppiella nova]
MYYANFWVGVVATIIVPIYFWLTFKQSQKLSGKRRALRDNMEKKNQVIKSFNKEAVESTKQLNLQKSLTENQMQTRQTSYIFDDGQMSIGMIMYHVLLFNNVSAPIRSLHQADHEIEASGLIKPQIHGKFELENVDFIYPNGHQALHRINMTIQPNKITALVGLSGAGKSTLISLLDKFYTPNSGCIKLDGIDLEQLDTHYLREHIGLPHASNEEVIAAAKKASIHEQILKLPHAYEADALLLSGGQQQRIALARMFLKNPPIIFLDEPTASLDAIASEQIKQSLDEIKQGRTVIMISHSLSQIIDADYTYVMKEGQIVEHEANHFHFTAWTSTFLGLSVSALLQPQPPPHPLTIAG